MGKSGKPVANENALFHRGGEMELFGMDVRVELLTGSVKGKKRESTVS